jgi:hypothetical protein
MAMFRVEARFEDRVAVYGVTAPNEWEARYRAVVRAPFPPLGLRLEVTPEVARCAPHGVRHVCGAVEVAAGEPAAQAH